jgi:ABC-type transport system involved in multi-copper enzyme maturation permease subunit
MREALMVPVEVRAFTLLAVCVLLLAAVLILQLLPRPETTLGRPLTLIILAVVAVLSIVVIVQTRQ